MLQYSHIIMIYSLFIIWIWILSVTFFLNTDYSFLEVNIALLALSISKLKTNNLEALEAKNY